MVSELEQMIAEYERLGIGEQIDYDKLYLYSIITHSTAIEGSTVTEIENQLLFDEGISPNKPMLEQLMNLDLKRAYERAYDLARSHSEITVAVLCELSALVMRNTGGSYSAMAGSFDSSAGDLRLLNVSAGRGGKSYLAWQKVEGALEEFCAWLNAERTAIRELPTDEGYKLSFEAHYRFVQTHPWADGNGRMSRLVMNMVQYEAGLIPSIVKKESRADYIQSLADASEIGDSAGFIEFMMRHHAENLRGQIEEYLQSTQGVHGEDSGQLPRSFLETSVTVPPICPAHARKTYVALARQPYATNKELSALLGVSDRTVRAHIGNLKRAGLIERAGSDRSGYWKILNWQ